MVTLKALESERISGVNPWKQNIRDELIRRGGPIGKSTRSVLISRERELYTVYVDLAKRVELLYVLFEVLANDRVQSF